MEQSKGPPIGIDLGTAYTRVAVFDGTNFKMIPDHHGNNAMPSYVAFTDTEVLIGESAREQAPQNPTNTIFDITRLIGRPFSDPSVQTGMKRWPFKVRGIPDDTLLVEMRWKGTRCHFTPVEICSMILMQVKENAEKNVGATTTDAVITVPVYFTYNQRQAIKQAGLIAGFNFLQIIGASSASAMFYSMERQSKYSNVFANITRSLLRVRPEEVYNMIIFDLGAGTLDVSLVTMKENVCKVRASAGDVLLGGSDFDNNMVDYFVSLLKKKGLTDIGNIPDGTIISLRTLCEKAKISLSSGNSKVRMKWSPFYRTDLDYCITETRFRVLNKELFLRCIDILKKCLMDANIGTNAVNEVILAGGSARIPSLQSCIGNLFEGMDLKMSDHMETATAYGAALQAFNLIQRVNGSTRLLFPQDVTPFSLGVKIIGVMDVIIPKNTSIPTRKKKTYLCSSSKTPFVVKVYEGEGHLTRENSLLGICEFFGTHIPPIGHDVTCCFEIHENGTLTVTAEEISSKTRDGITIANNNIEESQRRVGQALFYKESDKEYSIGIDFGTTYSSVAVWHRNGVKIIENEYGSRITCSVVAFTDSGRLIGNTVHKEHVMTSPTNTIPNIKRLIGRYGSKQSVHDDSEFLPSRVISGDKNRSMISVPYKNEEKLFVPEEIAAMILSEMKEVAEAHLNSKVSKAVISVPACFNDSQRKAIKDAGTIAGLDVLQLLNETTAAAIGYFLQNVSGKSSNDKTLLIFDLGGGNLDVSIVKIKEGTIRVQAVAGETNLGGEDFDNNMVSYFVKRLMKEKNKDISNKAMSLRRLRSACEKAKRVLSTNDQTVVEVDALDEGIDFRCHITRKLFEEFNEGLFRRSINCVERCLEDAMIDKQCIDEIFLVGGSTRIPKMQQLLQEFFNGKEVRNSINADEAVVYGAAVQAAILSGNEDRGKFNISDLQDVSSQSLLLDNRDGATMNLLIPKHFPIPAKKELIFFSCSDNLWSFSMEVRECDLASTMVFSVSGITAKQRGNSKINLYFEVDSSGILNLTAKDISGRAENGIMISKNNGGLTTEEIQKITEDAARYKAGDEEQKANAAALNFLENLAFKIKLFARDPKFSASTKKLIEKVTDGAITWLETNHHAGNDEIMNNWKMQLEDIQNQLFSIVDKVSALNSLENLVQKVKVLAQDPGISGGSKKSVEKAAYDAVAFLETSSDVAIDEIDAWIKKLEVICSQIVYLGTNSGS